MNEPTDKEREEMRDAIDEAILTWAAGEGFYRPDNQELWQKIRDLIFVSPVPRPKVTIKELVAAYTGGLYGYEFERLADLLREKGVEVEEVKP